MMSFFADSNDTIVKVEGEISKDLPIEIDINNPPVAMHFPEKVYLILENESTDIIRWESSDGVFRIVNHKRFENEISSKWFKRKYINIHDIHTYIIINYF